MTTSIKIHPELKNRIKQLAAVQHRSSHWIMLEAIKEYVTREEAKESFKQEALDSWSAYQETGKHLTGAEVHHWLSTWGTEQEKTHPACHS